MLKFTRKTRSNSDDEGRTLTIHDAFDDREVIFEMEDESNVMTTYLNRRQLERLRLHLDTILSHEDDSPYEYRIEE